MSSLGSFTRHIEGHGLGGLVGYRGNGRFAQRLNRRIAVRGQQPKLAARLETHAQGEPGRCLTRAVYAKRTTRLSVHAFHYRDRLRAVKLKCCHGGMG